MSSMILERPRSPLTKEIMKMYGNLCVFNVYGASHALRSIKETMKMYGNLYVSNNSGTFHALCSTNEIMRM